MKNIALLKKILFIGLIIVGCNNKIFSQIYVPIDTADRPLREKAIADYKMSSAHYIESIKNKYSGKTRKQLLSGYEEFSKEFENEIKDGRFSYDPRFLNYANKIFDELKRANPNIPQYTKILISKDGSLNAFCLPDGTFVLNMGLFYWLENRNQFASVLAHEISHKIEEHSLKKGISSIEGVESNKEKIHAIKKQKYNKNKAAFDLFKSTLYASGEQNKKDEYQADSLGITLLSKTSFNKISFIRTLELSALYDTIKPKGLKKETYKKLFDFPNQPFKEDWFKEEDFSAYNYMENKKLNSDSLASHPETVDRIKRLKNLFPNIEKEDITNVDDKEFEELQKIAENEMISNLYFFERYGIGIYLCLSELQRNPENEYYKYWLGKCFEKIYEGRKSYTVNRYLDKIGKDQSDSYRLFLNFMWNLSVDEIKNIADFYTKTK